jgi:hypothetical protein
MSSSRGGYQRLRWAARITTMGAVAVALIWSFILCFAVGEECFYAAGELVVVTFALSGMYVAVAIIAWQWSLVGGIIVVAAGALALNAFIPTNYDLWLEAPFDAACVICIIGGVLHLIRAYLIRRH